MCPVERSQSDVDPGAVEDTAELRAQIAERIREARVAAGYENASAFARAISTSPHALYRYERGGVVPSIFMLYDIARVSGVSMEWLVSGAEPDAEPALLAWLETPTGRAAPPEAVAFLRGLRLGGFTATGLFYDLALVAWTNGLDASEATLAARATAVRR